MTEPAEVTNLPVNVKPAEVKARLEAGGGVQAIVPRNIEEVFRLAQAIVKAGLAPASYEDDMRNPDPQKIVIGIMKGAEVGLPPITALSTICIINKRPCIWGDGAVALVQRSGLVVNVEQGYEGEPNTDAWTAFYRIWRKGQDKPYEGRFSVADAKRAHLWMHPKKKPWNEYPQRMLLARARAFALRDGFADCLAGLAIAEEARDIPSETPQLENTSFLDGDAPAADAPETNWKEYPPRMLSKHGPVPPSEPATAPEADLVDDATPEPKIAADEPEKPATDLLGDVTQPLHTEVGFKIGDLALDEWLIGLMNMVEGAREDGDPITDLWTKNRTAAAFWIDSGSAKAKRMLEPIKMEAQRG